MGQTKKILYGWVPGLSFKRIRASLAYHVLQANPTQQSPLPMNLY